MADARENSLRHFEKVPPEHFAKILKEEHEINVPALSDGQRRSGQHHGCLRLNYTGSERKYQTPELILVGACRPLKGPHRINISNCVALSKAE